MAEIPQQTIYPFDPRVEVSPHIPTASIDTVLDVGCGTGAFGKTLRNALGTEVDITGMDAMHENVIASKAANTYDRVYEGYFPKSLDSGREGPERFDLICFLDVLEHMFDPWGALQATHDHLTPNARVLASIPNIQVWTVIRGLIRGRWDYTDTGILDRTHVRFFTKRTILEMFSEAGFTVESCHGINPQLPTYWPPRKSINRRTLTDMKWLPKMVPNSQWLQYVIVARSNTVVTR